MREGHFNPGGGATLVESKGREELSEDGERGERVSRCPQETGCDTLTLERGGEAPDLDDDMGGVQDVVDHPGRLQSNLHAASDISSGEGGWEGGTVGGGARSSRSEYAPRVHGGVIHAV
jgi:hypothetical protein